MTKTKNQSSPGNNREGLFCYFMARLGNPGEAAIHAGYPRELAWETAAKLLGQKEIRQKIAHLTQEESETQARELALQGLRRLAFGSVNDAVELLCSREEELPTDLAKLDLFHVADLRRPKGGGWEVRFFSRLEALRLLLDYAKDHEPKPDTGTSSFYQALNQAAKTTPSGYWDGI